MRLGVRPYPAAVHAGSVEGHCEIAAPVDGDEPARAADFGDFFERRLGRLPQRPSAVLHLRRDVVRDDGAYEVFAVARAGDGASLVVSVGSGPDDGRVADAPEPLVRRPARLSPRAEVPRAVEADGPDRAELVLVERRRLPFDLRALRRGALLGLLRLLQLLPTLFRLEILRVDKLDALLLREGFGPLARHHDVRRLLHHEAREQDRILDPLQPRDRASLERAAVHDRGVE